MTIQVKPLTTSHLSREHFIRIWDTLTRKLMLFSEPMMKEEASEPELKDPDSSP